MQKRNLSLSLLISAAVAIPSLAMAVTPTAMEAAPADSMMQSDVANDGTMQAGIEDSESMSQSDAAEAGYTLNSDTDSTDDMSQYNDEGSYSEEDGYSEDDAAEEEVL